MTPLQHWPANERRELVGVFTDIDDTLTTDGALTPDALAALQGLKAGGLSVVAITGRPIGWCAPFAKLWPVDAMVAENGAVAFVHNKIGLQTTPALNSSLLKLYQQDASTRASNFQRIQTVAQRLLREVPGATLAQDSSGRETDIAIDHSEFTRLPPEQIAQVVQIMQAEGMSATVSSIHINGWYGSHNKLSGARWIVQQLYQRELDTELARWAYVGDSANDQVMFQHFAHSVGVANILGVAAQLAHLPRYVTVAERGAGFAEVAAAVLAARAP
ncbi:MAG: HAD-IIB family hydrolase [Rhodoferax sp.]|nr:HAD-IIB family hydrolase [Rhodoferax sp.]